MPDNHAPDALTNIKSTVTNNQTFAALAVKHGFHHHMKISDTVNLSSMDRFIQYQEKHGHPLIPVRTLISLRILVVISKDR